MFCKKICLFLNWCFISGLDYLSELEHAAMIRFMHLCLVSWRAISPHFPFAWVTSACPVLAYWHMDSYYTYMMLTYTQNSMPLPLTHAPFVPKTYWELICGECTVCSGEHKDYFSKWAAFAYFVESLPHKWLKEIISHMDCNAKYILNLGVILCKIINWDLCALGYVLTKGSFIFMSFLKLYILNIFMVCITQILNAELRTTMKCLCGTCLT